MPSSQSTAARRSVVPDGAGRSLWRAAVWTGLGTVIATATLSIVVVALCWLPVSGPTGRTNSAIRAGLLTLLASIHGGITVDGTHAWWLPLGLTAILGLVSWRAGAGLADAAAALDEQDPSRLVVALVAQTAASTVGLTVLVPFASLGTSSAPFVGVFLGGLIWFTLTGGVAFAWHSPLRGVLAEALPPRLGRAARAAAAALAVYLAGGALLVLGSIVVHHGRVETIAGQVGGGWGGIPILLLGVLAAPNAAISGAAYLTGPGFAVGSGTVVGPLNATHGVLPAFPLLGAVPSGDGANSVVWVLMALTTVGAGTAIARTVARTSGWLERCADGAAACGLVLVFGFLLGWQAGGSVGDAGLAAVGPSPWQFGFACAVLAGGVAALELGAVAAWQLVRADPFTGITATTLVDEDVDDLDDDTGVDAIDATADESSDAKVDAGDASDPGRLAG